MNYRSPPPVCRFRRRRLRRRRDARAGARTVRHMRTVPRAEIDATSLGVRPNAESDQSTVLQRAIAQAAAAGARAALCRPEYIAPAHCNCRPMRRSPASSGATRLVMAGGPSMLTAAGSDYVSISGLVLDGDTFRCPTAAASCI